MATPSRVRATGRDVGDYRWLESRPDNWRKQLWLKGRHMTVGQLVYGMRAGEMLDDPSAAAREFDLPEEQVREALDYYRRFRDIVEADAVEERRWLTEQGHSLEPRR